jgi:DAK2 domain fusion protein YloV
MTDADRPAFPALIHSAARALKDRRDEVNKLNVFPVPDGDTGTNMALTMDAVLAEVDRLPKGAGLAEIAHAITHGSLMGARGNSGVILSQILRGLCEVIAAATTVDERLIGAALDRSVTVAFQAVRKPVEGTMLTVLRDAAAAARPAIDAGKDVSEVLEAVVDAAFASVARTPELLPVLKEAGVVDAGGYGLAILAEGFVSALDGHEVRAFDVTTAPSIAIGLTPADDWDDDEYLYCTEFLIFGEGLDRDSIEDYLSSRGGSQLVVGDPSALKVHVHTDAPAEVLAYAASLGEIAEVHVNNMRRQTATRAEALRQEQSGERKPLGFVAVAAGKGLADILLSLGVDRVVSGGQTMNPSTADLLEAIEDVAADAVIVLPDNRNIIMAAQQTVGIASKPVGVVPTTSVPQAFAAMLAAEPSAPLEDNVATMTESAAGVRTGEITAAVKDSKGKAGRIKKGQLIGICDHEIEAIGDDLGGVAEKLLSVIVEDGETLTLLAGADLKDDELHAIEARLAAAQPQLQVETLRGEQPLYPLIMSVE